MTTRVVIIGTFPDVLPEIIKIQNKFPLVVVDPPYGNIVKAEWDQVGSDTQFSQKLIDWSRIFSSILYPGGAFYMWGGIGQPKNRPFFKAILGIEEQTDFELANIITWSKKRAYGVQNNYLFTREELAFFVKGDKKKPRKFEVPLLDTKRSYEGYNKKYPAKSQFFRRTSVWSDITEILRGKTHETQKPDRLHQIPIQVHTEPGETVLDTFAGSLMTGRAAASLDRGFILVEREKKYVRDHIHTLPPDTIVIEHVSANKLNIK